jgi:FAD-linked oxidoreductase
MSTEPIEDFTFTNYGGNLEIEPVHYYKPESEDEVRQIVASVAQRGRGLRVVGAGHSWSAIATSEANMMTLDALDKLVSVDKERSQVTVQAGIRIHALTDLLEAHGLALPNLGSIQAQSIAGAVGTGTHGTGLTFGNMSTMLAAMTLVRADGTRLTIRRDEQPDLMKMAAVSLGMLGVTVEVTLQCVPALDLEYVAWPMPYDEVPKILDELLHTHAHVRLYWFTGTDVIQVMTMNPTKKPRSPVNRVAQYFKDIVLDTDLLAVLQHVGHFFPGLVGPFNKFSESVGFVREERVDRSDRILTIPMPPVHEETEYSLPVTETVRVLADLPDLVAKNDIKINLPIEYRFVAGDENALSPAQGRDSVYVGAYTYGESFAQPMFATIEPYLKSLGGRPHWGKHLQISAEEVRAMYPGYDAFCAVRRDMDPHGVFTNALTRTLFP